MPTQNLPIQYHLDIYKNSFINDPTACFQSSTPFMAMNVGEFIDITGHGYDVSDKHWLKVTAVRHRIWEIANSHIGHQIGVTTVEVPWPDK